MAHFYGVIDKSSRKMSATATGNKETGLGIIAASYKGAIKVVLTHNPDTGKDEFLITQTKHQQIGVEQVLAAGNLGERL